MGLPRSTFYDAPAAHLDDTEIVDRIRTICDEFEAYGYGPLSDRERIERMAEATDVDLSLMTRSTGGNDRPKGPVALDLSSIGAKSPAEGRD